jgi:hypothetical protein
MIRPRSPGVVQSAIARVVPGQPVDCASPLSAKHSASAVALLAEPNSAHAIAEAKRPRLTRPRAPSRSAAIPLGTCPAAYETRNAVSISARLDSERPSSRATVALATLKPLRPR